MFDPLMWNIQLKYLCILTHPFKRAAQTWRFLLSRFLAHCFRGNCHRRWTGGSSLPPFQRSSPFSLSSNPRLPSVFLGFIYRLWNSRRRREEEYIKTWGLPSTSLLPPLSSLLHSFVLVVPVLPQSLPQLLSRQVFKTPNVKNQTQSG